jgi:hypothetical protein
VGVARVGAALGEGGGDVEVLSGRRRVACQIERAGVQEVGVGDLWMVFDQLRPLIRLRRGEAEHQSDEGREESPHPPYGIHIR